MRVPELIAHRGYARHFPENTLLAIDAAVRAGARFVEVDIQLTRDLIPVLYHDRTLKRLCDAEGAVSDYSAQEIKQLHPSDFDRFGYRYHHAEIATLEELRHYIKEHPELTVFIEVKRVAIERFGIEKTLAPVWREMIPVLRQCVLISYSAPLLAAARRQGWPALGAVIDHWAERQAQIMRDIRPDFLFCDLPGLPRFGGLAFGASRLAVFEVADAAQALALARRGVQYIETFAIGELRAELELALAAP